MAGKRRPWKPDEDAYLVGYYATRLTAEVAAALGRTVNATRQRALELGLHKSRELRAAMSRGARLWTAAQDEALRQLYPTALAADLARQFGRTADQVYRRAHRLGLSKEPGYMARYAAANPEAYRQRGKVNGFQPGHVPANKGRKRPGWSVGRMRETQFKKGRPASQAANYRPIGSEKVCPKRGVLMRKMTDEPSIYPVKRWTPVHVLVWTAAHGPVPPGCIVRFRQGMKTLVAADITVDRLECVTLAENMARNTVHNLPPELMKVTMLRGALNRAIRRKKDQP